MSNYKYWYLGALERMLMNEPIYSPRNAVSPEVDARVLGQILAAQNIEQVLTDISLVADFYAETLFAIPGIVACSICLENVTVSKGEMGVAKCEECLGFRKKTDHAIDAPIEMPPFKCELGDLPGIQLTRIHARQHHFGIFVFRVGDLDFFNLYKPFITNLATYIATSLENRQQRDALQRAHVELENRVAERTAALAATNLHLQEEIHHRKQIEEALREREKHAQSLLRLSRKLESAQTYVELMRAGRDEIQNLLGYQNLWAYLFSPDKKHARALQAQGPMADLVMSEVGTGVLTVEGDRMMEEFVQTTEIQVIEDAQTDPRVGIAIPLVSAAELAFDDAAFGSIIQNEIDHACNGV